MFITIVIRRFPKVAPFVTYSKVAASRHVSHSAHPRKRRTLQHKLINDFLLHIAPPAHFHDDYKSYKTINGSNCQVLISPFLLHAALPAQSRLSHLTLDRLVARRGTNNIGCIWRRTLRKFHFNVFNDVLGVIGGLLSIFIEAGPTGSNSNDGTICLLLLYHRVIR